MAAEQFLKDGETVDDVGGEIVGLDGNSRENNNIVTTDIV